MKVELSKAEVDVLRYLLREADSGWGEPFKDFEGEDPELAVQTLLKKLKG